VEERVLIKIDSPRLAGGVGGKNMKRKAFVMRLNPGCEAEYKRRHDAIWPELKAELRKAGVSNYSIFLDRETNTLFAFQHLADDADGENLSQQDVVKKWWHMMKDLMDTNPDESPVSGELIEVFHMD
jgi:L-rhamnose mutarotase